MKKIVSLLLAFVMCFTLLAACGGNTPETTKPAESTNPGETTAPTEPTEEPSEPYVYYYVRSSEDTTINPHNGNGGENQNIIDNVVSTLYRMMPNEDGTAAVLTPDLAESIPETTDGGKTWIIKVNKDAKFSNGEPITAETFIYSWKMHLDPNLFWATGASLASGDIDIVNATAYYKQASGDKEVKWEDVGLKALDEYTIEISCTQKYLANDVMRHFRMRGSSPVYQPIYDACIAADGKSSDYGTALDKMMFTGPYMLESWTKGTECVFVPNPYWVHRDLIHIDRIESRVATDEATRLELFEAGLNDCIDLGTNGMEKYGEDPRVRTYSSQTLYFLEVNQNNPDKPWMADPDFRKAVFYAIDREAIAKLTNNVPAPWFMSKINQIPDGTNYRDHAEAQALVDKYVGEKNGYHPEEANAYLDKVMAKYGLSKIEINILYTESSENYRAASEYLQGTLPKVLGEDRFSVTLSAASKDVCKSTMKASVKAPSTEWDLCWFGQSLAAEVFASYRRMQCYLNTDSKAMTKYSNEVVVRDYELIQQEENRLSVEKSLALTVEMEESMYEDMTAIPVHGPLSYMLYSDKVNLPMKNYAYGVTFGWQYSTMNPSK